MSNLIPRGTKAVVLVLGLVAGNAVNAAPAVIDATAIQPVGFSFQLNFGTGKNLHHRKHQHYKRYGHGYNKRYPYYGNYRNRYHHNSWTKHGYLGKHRNKHYKRHGWYGYY